MELTQQTVPKPIYRLLQLYFSIIAVASLLALYAIAGAGLSLAQDQPARENVQAHGLEPIRTGSPRETLATFQHLSKELETSTLQYLAAPSLAGASELALLSDQFIALIDLEAVPAATRRETGIRTYGVLLDIFGRIDLPNLSTVPDLENIEAADIKSFRVPQTPLRLVQVADGEREGEFLFAGSTVQIAPRFLETIRGLPLNTRLDTDSIAVFGKQLTGPLVPPGIVRAVPPSMTRLWLDTPIWKVVSMSALIVVATLLILALRKMLRVIPVKDRANSILLRLPLPVAVLSTVTIITPFLSRQINISGQFANIIATGETVVAYLSIAWGLWLAVRLVVEWIIRSPHIADQSLDAGMLRLIGAIVGAMGFILVMAAGGQAIGLPVLSVLAGLGIGGIAVALAVRPTLENLIGGVILYIDRPVKVGDFCTFGDQTGTVEAIGIRSTQLRALDRTLISVPNAQFADMKIINWAECDEMLAHSVVGVRYETTPDQLRFLLAQIRRMLHAHPRINSDTVRVRFSGFGESSLTIDIRAYVMTREWNDFFAVREDIYFRIYEIVGRSGTSFAFPSQTLYVRRDAGVDQAKAEEIESTVAEWRQNGQLPFPRLTPDEIARLKGTLDYPAKGSPEAGADAISAEIPGAEPLSTDLSEPDRHGVVTSRQEPDRPRSRSSRRDSQ